HAIKAVAAPFAAKAAAIDDGIQTIESPKQTLSAADVGGKLLNLRLGRGRAERRGRDAKEAGASLVGGDQAVFGVQANAHPRALLPGDGVKQLHLEVLGHLDALDGSRLAGDAVALAARPALAAAESTRELEGLADDFLEGRLLRGGQGALNLGR